MNHFESLSNGIRRRHGRQALCWFLFVMMMCSGLDASTSTSTSAQHISREDLLSGAVLGLSDELPALVSNDEVFALSDEMRVFLNAHVDENAGGFVKLNQLVHAVITGGEFDLKYEEATRTASEAFRTKRANCMSFTNMFVVLARAVGIEASFQEVDIPPVWSFSKDTYVLNGHINIFVDLGVSGEQIVDFNIAEFKSTYPMRLVSDERALAHFFNNMGAEAMQRGELTAAFIAFRRAVEDDNSFSPAWNNLGTLYGRYNLINYAEAAYLQALKVNRIDLVAMSNLTTLYDYWGKEKQAARYRKKIEHHRKQNPYLRSQLAREAFFDQDYDSAISHLRFAVRKRRSEDRFCFLLGLVYLHMGDEKKSRAWMARAARVATDNTVKDFYSTKIESLKAASR